MQVASLLFAHPSTPNCVAHLCFGRLLLRLLQVNYIMGVNPQGYSLITGLGARRVTQPVDDDSVYDTWVSLKRHHCLQ